MPITVGQDTMKSYEAMQGGSDGRRGTRVGPRGSDTRRELYGRFCLGENGRQDIIGKAITLGQKSLMNLYFSFISAE